MIFPIPAVTSSLCAKLLLPLVLVGGLFAGYFTATDTDTNPCGTGA
jgi:TRAP-type C4-dicarboxylate transport system permease large subunit